VSLDKEENIEFQLKESAIFFKKLLQEYAMIYSESNIQEAIFGVSMDNEENIESQLKEG
jgi:hypothetical protein